MSQGIRVVTTKATDTWIKGTELGFDSIADADKTLGEENYKITANADGTPYQAPKKALPDEKLPKDEG